MSKNRMLVGMAAFVCAVGLLLASCGKGREDPGKNLLPSEEKNERVVNLFSPMEKTAPNMENAARSASEKTVIMAEEKLGVKVEYITYTAENYKEKTYDQVSIERAIHRMDDLYLLNPDAIRALGEEGKLMDLSGLENVKNLRDVIRAANEVDGKLVAIPQEVVAYGLFINKDMFDQYGLGLPKTPEEFLECCRVFI